MEISLPRDLMSDEEWSLFEHFIVAVRAPNGRKPTNHRLVLDGIFLDCAHRITLAGPAGRLWQMVERLQAVSTVDLGGPLGRHTRSVEPKRGRPGRPADDR